ncbi:MAG: DUF3095 domain-containing protein [Thermostichales cyanobacterium BF4_bins_65]
MAENPDQFYQSLPTLTRLIQITEPEHFVPVPQDWLIAMTDVVGSTAAIRAGRYKEINLIGACSIVSVLNAVGNLEIPFIFGGDGATLLIPPSQFEATKQALLGTKLMARQAFNLDLRVGIIPIAAVTQNHPLQIAKLAIAPHYAQAVIKGGALLAANELLKSSPQFRYELDPTTRLADFSGLECRWQDIPSRHGEILTLLVLATPKDPEISDDIYRQVIAKLEAIYGSEEALHPVDGSSLRLSFQDQQLIDETRVYQPTIRGIQRWLAIFKLKMINLLGWFLMRFHIKVGQFNWGTYKQLVIAATDYKKFDDVLRLVISSSPQQRQQLHEFLEQQFQSGNLVYGIHTSDRALMTCLVFERSGRQVHFIDGADGGYTLSAQKLKQRLLQSTPLPLPSPTPPPRD